MFGADVSSYDVSPCKNPRVVTKVIFVSSSSVLFKRDKSSRDIFPFSRNPVHVLAMTDRDLGVVPMQKVIAE